MGERWLLARFQLGNDLVDKHLTQFDTPLIKRVDIPDRPLSEGCPLYHNRRPSQPRQVVALATEIRDIVFPCLGLT